MGALNPNSVLCTDQALSPAFCALNPGSMLNPRTLNPGTTVLVFLFQKYLAAIRNQRRTFQLQTACIYPDSEYCVYENIADNEVMTNLLNSLC